MSEIIYMKRVVPAGEEIREELARRLGWPQQHVNRYLTGTNDLTTEKADELLAVLGLEVRKCERGKVRKKKNKNRENSGIHLPSRRLL